MAVTQLELGKRLRVAREACHLTQDEVARHLGVSRATIAQMELGNRAVTSLELDRLAYIYARDMRQFVADDPAEDDSLVALFRLHPEVSGQEEVFAALRDCLALGRETTNLEGLLEIDRDTAALAAYPLRPPRTKWEAIQQGERIAAEERRRLSLGSVPLPDVAGLLEAQGVRTAQVLLPEDLSGLTLAESDVGVLVVANLSHHFLRRRFSYAHEYCHVMLDREQKGAISRVSDRDNFQEVRANSFAACFLMPGSAVQEFIRGLGKGNPSRLEADVFDEDGALHAQARPAPGSQKIQMYDVVLMAHHFGVSRVAALYRLKNLKLIADSEFEALRAQEESGVGAEVAKLLGLPEPDPEQARNEFRHRFLALGLEALRRGEITRRKLGELAAAVDVTGEELDRVLDESGLEEQDDAIDLLLPGD